MDLKEFRLLHSELVEHYQFIEFHLEGICAVLYGGSIYDGMKQVEKHSISRLIQEVRRLEKGRNVPILTEAEWEEVEQVNQRRNFWCHQCYVDMVFDLHTGGPKRKTDIDRFHSDLARASRLRDLLYERKMDLG